MTDSSSYKATDLDAAQFNAMINLIKIPGLNFTKDEEFELNENRNEKFDNL